MNKIDDSSIKFKNADIDFMVKEKMMLNFETATNHLIRQGYREGFEALKVNFYFINPYDFDNKPVIVEMIDALTNYFDSLSNTAPPKRMDEVLFKNNVRYQLKKLMDMLFSELALAYARLGIWLTNIKVNNDMDIRISEEVFNDEFTGFDNKKKELLKFKTEELLEFFSMNAIHDGWASMKIRYQK